MEVTGGPYVHKCYWVVVHARQPLPLQGTVDLALPGSGQSREHVPAITHYKVKCAAPGLAWLECELVTGDGLDSLGH